MIKNTQLLSYLAAASILATAGSAFAQDAATKDPSFAMASDKDLAELEKGTEGVEWKAGALAGLVLTTGNAQTTTLTAGATASRKADNNKLALQVSGAYARASILSAADVNGNGTIEDSEYGREASTQARSLEGRLRYDRYLSKMDSLYASALGLTNEPAGKNFVGGGQLGYSRTAFSNDRHELVVEAGYDFSYEDPTVGDSFQVHSIRAFAGYESKLSADTGFNASVEGLFNLNEIDAGAIQADRFEDTRVNTRLALTTKLFEDISFRFGFEARYDNVPNLLPAFSTPFATGLDPRAQELDTKTEATLIINFL